MPGVGEAVEEDITDDEQWNVEDEQAQAVIPQVSYDKNDPPMSVGTTYSSITEFRLTMSQYDINHEFEYKIDKSEPCKFKAKYGQK